MPPERLPLLRARPRRRPRPRGGRLRRDPRHRAEGARPTCSSSPSGMSTRSARSASSRRTRRSACSSSSPRRPPGGARGLSGDRQRRPGRWADGLPPSLAYAREALACRIRMTLIKEIEGELTAARKRARRRAPRRARAGPERAESGGEGAPARALRRRVAAGAAARAEEARRGDGGVRRRPAARSRPTARSSSSR